MLCNVVSAPIPLLFSKAGMKKAGVTLDFVNDRMVFHNQQVVLQDLGVGHYGVYIRPKGTLALNLEHSLVADLNTKKPFEFPDDFDDQVKMMKKLHLQFGHCPKKTLIKIIKEANSWFPQAPAALDKIYSLSKASSLPSLCGVVSSKVVLEHMKAMEACHKAHSEALFSRKIRDALRHKIRAQQSVSGR